MNNILKHVNLGFYWNYTLDFLGIDLTDLNSPVTKLHLGYFYNGVVWIARNPYDLNHFNSIGGLN